MNGLGTKFIPGAEGHPPLKSYPPETIASLLEVFMPSGEMREYLRNHPPSRQKLLDMIIGAPVSLQKKADILKELSIHEDLAVRYHQEINTALKALSCRSGEILLMKEAWYDEDLFYENIAGDVPFQTMEAVVSYLGKKIREEEWDEDTLIWTVLEKWDLLRDGTYENPYSFILINEEPVYFTKNRLDKDQLYWLPETYKYADSRDLNLSVPFHVGDIVTLDCRPFAPVKYAVLLETGDDCCALRGLLPEEDGLWHNVALKHGHGWDGVAGYIPRMSVLYRMSTWTGDLSEEEKLMKNVQAFLRDEIEKGRRMSYDFYKISNADLEKYLSDEG